CASDTGKLNLSDLARGGNARATAFRLGPLAFLRQVVGARKRRLGGAAVIIPDRRVPGFGYGRDGFSRVVRFRKEGRHRRRRRDRRSLAPRAYSKLHAGDRAK